jgi:hypothetical protein
LLDCGIGAPNQPDQAGASPGPIEAVAAPDQARDAANTIRPRFGADPCPR